MTLLTSIKSPANTAVIGATGGIGQALVELLNNEPAVSWVHAFSRNATNAREGKIYRAPISLCNEQSILDAATKAAKIAPLDVVFVASGILHRGTEIRPEKTMGSLSHNTMSEVIAVNTIGPTLIAKHFLPVMRKKDKSVFAVLSARVGSISDNRLGGWLSYRTSKAALNMALKTLSIEHARRHPQSIVVSLHPGTVDTPLSEPFSKTVANRSLFTPIEAATHLISVVDNLSATDSGGFFGWDGLVIEY